MAPCARAQAPKPMLPGLKLRTPRVLKPAPPPPAAFMTAVGRCAAAVRRVVVRAVARVNEAAAAAASTVEARTAEETADLADNPSQRRRRSCW